MERSGRYVSRESTMTNPIHNDQITQNITAHSNPNEPFVLNTGGVPDIFMENIAQQIDENESIWYIKWINVPPGRNAIDIFFSSLLHPERIKSVYLVLSEQLTRDDYQSIGVLQRLTSLKSFSLQNATITEANVSVILSTVVRCPTIKHLLFGNCRFVSATGNLALMGSLFDTLLKVNTCILKKLQFTKTNVDDNFVRAMVPGLIFRLTLKDLGLAKTQITHHTLALLYVVFEQRQTLMIIDMNYCPRLGKLQEFIDSIVSKEESEVVE